MASENVASKMLLTLNNPVFRAFVTYGTIVVLKMIAMSAITAVYRFTSKSFANVEDCVGFKDKDGKPLKPVVNPDVERVRRCHLNDIENIIPFFLIGLLYVTTGPDLSTALILFRTFTASRIFHTLAYLIPLSQPARGLTFIVGIIINIFMAVSILKCDNCFF